MRYSSCQNSIEKARIHFAFAFLEIQVVCVGSVSVGFDEVPSIIFFSPLASKTVSIWNFQSWKSVPLNFVIFFRSIESPMCREKSLFSTTTQCSSLLPCLGVTENYNLSRRTPGPITCESYWIILVQWMREDRLITVTKRKNIILLLIDRYNLYPYTSTSRLVLYNTPSVSLSIIYSVVVSYAQVLACAWTYLKWRAIIQTRK